MRPKLNGSSRTLLLSALGLAAALLGVSVWLVLSGDPGTRPRDRADPEGDVVPLGTAPAAREGEGPRRRGGGEAGDEGWDDEDWDDEDYAPGGVSFDRDPDGPILHVTPELLRAVLADRHFEEVLRMIDVFQREGRPIPEDVVRDLLALLEDEGYRIDAVRALGLVRDESVGRMLGELADNPAASLEVRMAGLDALAQSGNLAALAHVQSLLARPETDERLLRHALPALGAMGGPEATHLLVGFLLAHPEDDLTDSAVVALARAQGSDAELARTLREAAGNADPLLLQTVVKVAHVKGADAGPELRQEIARLVQSASAFEFVEDPDRRLALRGSAMAAAAAMGDELIAPVVTAALQDVEGLRDVALHSLRNARGDESARALVRAVDQTQDPHTRWGLLVALGDTASREGTSTLVEFLGDEAVNLRHAASASLSKVRDPAAVEPMLAALERSGPDDHMFAQNLIKALGTTGANEALPTLRALAKSQDQGWADLMPYIRNAIARIESGNPDSQLLSPASKD